MNNEVIWERNDDVVKCGDVGHSVSTNYNNNKYLIFIPVLGQRKKKEEGSNEDRRKGKQGSVFMAYIRYL